MVDESTKTGGLPLRTTRVLIVDDEDLVRWSLRERLEEEGHEVLEANSGAKALELFASGVDLVLLDWQLPDADGNAVLKELCRADGDVPVIMITAHSSVEHAVAAMKAGAFHYVAKPFDLDGVVLTVQRGLETTRLRRQVRALTAQRDMRAGRIIGESSAIRRVKDLIPRIAASPASTVLITGESGTGKDLAAREIHQLSDRKDRPFVNITCSALPSALLESELFGHERGAFTDARVRKDGLFQRAEGGTIFLDEVGEMELQLQAKLLRVLEEKAFRRVGGSEELRTDVRIVAATNVDLKQAVRDGQFREDLYYRLAVVTLHLPPLREREGDIDLLTAFLIDRFNQEFGKNLRSLSPPAQRLLRTHPWPGNVRELRNAIERAVLLSEGETLDEKDFAFLRETTVEEAVFRLPAGGIDLRDLERSLVEQALARTGGNQTRAGELLGLNRDQIRYRIERYGLPRRTQGSEQDSEGFYRRRPARHRYG
jgi:DNA-binding NtrC family response regulator